MKLALALSTIAFCVFNFQFSKAQNIGIGTNTPHASAALDVTSTNSGLLPPRMTFAQRNAIANPAQGLIIYCTDCGNNGGEPQYFNGSVWLNLIGGYSKIPAIIDNIPSIAIGTQIWSSKNLDVATYRNGDPIPQVTDPVIWNNLTTGAWCWLNNDSATNGAIYGRLYNWYAVNDPRGLAPQGWHVPSDAEWNKLVKFIDPSGDTICQVCSQSATAGGAMKDASTNYWSPPNTGATNSSGFAGLPGGYRYYEGTFFGSGGYDGAWWGSTEANSDIAWYHSLTYNFADKHRFGIYKTAGLSVRVVKD